MPSIIISGVRDLNRSLDDLQVRMSMAARNTVVKGGAIVAKNAKSEFTELAVDKSGVARVLESGEKRLRGERAGSRYSGGHLSEGGSRPHARTGKLRTSIKVAEVRQVGYGRWMSKTGPTMIYGRRVERGFHGQDSLMRIYDQPGYPYMAPGFAKSRDELLGLYESEVRRALHG